MIGLRTVGQAFGRHPPLLCRRHLVVFVKSQPIWVGDGEVMSEQAAHWGIGLLASGELEVLGVWLESTSGGLHWQRVLEDLKVRGVETIQFVASDESTDLSLALCEAFSGATVLPLTDLAPSYALPPRLRRIVLSGNEAVQQLQGSVSRAVGRSGRFADCTAAASFLLEALMRAERGL